MMIGNNTSCRNVCAIQAIMMITLPDLNADGALTSASRVNRYAVHIVPTMIVIFSPTLALKRAIGPGPCNVARISDVFGGGPVTWRCSIRGCGTYSNGSMRRGSHG